MKECIFLGHCQEDGHDKVWGLFRPEGTKATSFVVVWGKRGTKLQSASKELRLWSDLDKLIEEKKAKGYKYVTGQRGR